VRDLNRTSVILDINLAGLGSLRPPKQTSKHLTSLTLVTVDSLLAQQDQVDVLLLDNGLQHLGDGQRLGATVGLLRYIDVESSVGTHGHSSAQDIRAFRTTGGKCEDIVDFDGTLALAQTDGLFD
jgi:hypothetical protein